MQLTASMNTDDDFPLITVRPAFNAGNGWVALLLDAERPLDNAALARVLSDYALAETLAEIPCVALVDPLRIDPGLAAGLPRDRLILRFPLAPGTDPDSREALAVLRKAGFGLMATGVPASDALLAPGISALAVTCPSGSFPASLMDWLRRLPGPHLAMDSVGNVCPDACHFRWMSGHFASPVVPANKSDPTARSLLLKLLSLVTRDAESAEIEALIKRDASLAYKLLKLVNSVAFMPGRHIESFSQALVLLGRRQLQRWLMLLLFARPPGSETASPLLPQAAQRATLLEGIAKRKGLSRDDWDHAFMIGMFSLLDILFGVPLAEVIAPLHLSDEVTQALLKGHGQLGAFLQTVRIGEGGPTPELAEALGGIGLSREEWGAALIEATRWAVMVSKEA
jgi:c-di-GMP phosphodiesterase